MLYLHTAGLHVGLVHHPVVEVLPECQDAHLISKVELSSSVEVKDCVE